MLYSMYIIHSYTLQQRSFFFFLYFESGYGVCAREYYMLYNMSTRIFFNIFFQLFMGLIFYRGIWDMDTLVTGVLRSPTPTSTTTCVRPVSKRPQCARAATTYIISFMHTLYSRDLTDCTNSICLVTKMECCLFTNRL